MREDITNLFCFVDDFCIEFEKHIKSVTIGGEEKVVRKPRLRDSELVTIMLIYHESGYKNFKAFCYDKLHMYRQEFPGLLSYNRLVELLPRVLHIFAALLHFLLKKDHNGVSFADSTPIEVCTPKRRYSHKVLKAFANLGRSSKGWFYGMKLHLIITTQGELVDVKLTPGNTDDRNALSTMTKRLKGLLFADKGYIGKNIFEKLWNLGIKLITGIRKNMQNKLMNIYEKEILRKRVLIESVFSVLKTRLEIEHSRHRSLFNSLIHIISTLVSYSLNPHKPHIPLKPLIPNSHP